MGVKVILLVANGDELGEGVSLEKSSNLFGDCIKWAELPGSAWVSKVRTPKLNKINNVQNSHMNESTKVQNARQ